MKTYQRSFAAGEVAPQLYGRIDLAKYQTGLAKCLNFIVTPQGPVMNRPGFEFVRATKHNDKQSVLIPFSYNSEQTFALEFGDEYIRFHTEGATLISPTTADPWVSTTDYEPGEYVTYGGSLWQRLASPVAFNVNGASDNGAGLIRLYLPITGILLTVGQRVNVTGVVGVPGVNADWVIAAVGAAISPIRAVIDLTGSAFSGAWVSGGVVSNRLTPGTDATVWSEVTAGQPYEVATPYVEADLFDLHFVQSADVLTIVHPGYAQRELRRLGAASWQLTTISFDPTISAPGGAPTVSTAGAGGGSPENHTYLTTALTPGTLEESYPSLGAGVAMDLTVAGNRVLVDTVPVSGAIRYNVYEFSGGIYAYVGQTDGTQFVDNNITPDTSKTPPIPNNPFTGAGTWPRAVSYHEQRRCFGGSSNLPQTIWMTRSGTESNMSYSIPAQDDDSITARIVAREAQVIRHLVPLGDLLALTSGGVWRISPGNADYLSPSSFKPQAFSYVGASNAQPAVAGQSVLYAPDRGAHIREVTYKANDVGGSGFVVEDVCVLAPHLFDYAQIVQLAYAKAPLQTLWAIRNDGVLLGLTHVPEHDVKAWHQHDTQGTFESVCSVAEGDEDGVYVIVQRTVNSQQVRYVERMASRQFTALEDCFFVDCGLTYDGAPATTISGLGHLEGCDVAVLADGGAETATVTGGQITLSAAASKVHIGLAYNSDFQTLPLSLEIDGTGQGAGKNVSQVRLRVKDSKGFKVGPTFDSLTPYKQRTTEQYGTPTELVTAVLSVKPTPSWQEDGAVCVRQSDPLPLTITSITLESASGG